MFQKEKREKMFDEMDAKWKLLMEKHPWVFEHLYRPPECATGWYGLLDNLMNRIEMILCDIRAEEWPSVVQIKEKFGGLRFYAEMDRVGCDGEKFVEVERMIEDAESQSFSICEFCGENGSLRKGRRWIRTLCDSCDKRTQEL